MSFCIHLGLRIFKLKIFFPNFISKFTKPDIILASSPQLPAAFICLLFSKIIKRPFIFEVRDLWPQVLIDQSNCNKNSFLIKVLDRIQRILYKKSDHVVVLSNGCIEYVKRKGAKNVTFLPNGPDLKIFKKIDPINKISKFDKQNPLKILYTGAHGD